MDVHPNAVTARLSVGGVEPGDVGPPHRIETERLRLLRAHPEAVDVDRLHALFADTDADVFALCGWSGHNDESDTESYLDRRTAEWAAGRRFEYVLQADGEYVGTACVERDGEDGHCEYGLWLRRDHWGRGFAGEQADATIHAAFEHLDAPFVVVGCLPKNDRSRRAIEGFVARYGGAYYGSPPTTSRERRESEDPDVVPHHEWTITREQYERGERGLSTFLPGVEYDALAFEEE